MSDSNEPEILDEGGSSAFSVVVCVVIDSGFQVAGAVNNFVSRGRQAGVSLRKNAFHAQEESSLDFDRLSLLMTWMIVGVHWMVWMLLRWERVRVRRGRLIIEVVYLWIRYGRVDCWRDYEWRACRV